MQNELAFLSRLKSLEQKYKALSPWEIKEREINMYDSLNEAEGDPGQAGEEEEVGFESIWVEKEGDQSGMRPGQATSSQQKTDCQIRLTSRSSEIERIRKCGKFTKNKSKAGQENPTHFECPEDKELQNLTEPKPFKADPISFEQKPSNRTTNFEIEEYKPSEIDVKDQNQELPKSEAKENVRSNFSERLLSRRIIRPFRRSSLFIRKDFKAKLESLLKDIQQYDDYKRQKSSKPDEDKARLSLRNIQPTAGFASPNIEEILKAHHKRVTNILDSSRKRCLSLDKTERPLGRAEKSRFSVTKRFKQDEMEIEEGEDLNELVELRKRIIGLEVENMHLLIQKNKMKRKGNQAREVAQQMAQSLDAGEGPADLQKTNPVDQWRLKIEPDIQKISTILTEFQSICSGNSQKPKGNLNEINSLIPNYAIEKCFQLRIGGADQVLRALKTQKETNCELRKLIRQHSTVVLPSQTFGSGPSVDDSRKRHHLKTESDTRESQINVSSKKNSLTHFKKVKEGKSYPTSNSKSLEKEDGIESERTYIPSAPLKISKNVIDDENSFPQKNAKSALANLTSTVFKLNPPSTPIILDHFLVETNQKFDLMWSSYIDDEADQTIDFPQIASESDIDLESQQFPKPFCTDNEIELEKEKEKEIKTEEKEIKESSSIKESDNIRETFENERVTSVKNSFRVQLAGDQQQSIFDSQNQNEKPFCNGENNNVVKPICKEAGIQDSPKHLSIFKVDQESIKREMNVEADEENDNTKYYSLEQEDPRENTKFRSDEILNSLCPEIMKIEERDLEQKAKILKYLESLNIQIISSDTTNNLKIKVFSSSGMPSSLAGPSVFQSRTGRDPLDSFVIGEALKYEKLYRTFSVYFDNLGSKEWSLTDQFKQECWALMLDKVLSALTGHIFDIKKRANQGISWRTLHSVLSDSDPSNGLRSGIVDRMFKIKKVNVIIRHYKVEFHE